MRDDKINSVIVRFCITNEFRKVQGNKITWQTVLECKGLKQQFQRLYYRKTKDLQKFKTDITAIYAKDLQYIISQNAQYLSRKNVYHKITNYTTLISEIENYPQGIRVDEELLFFTYKDIEGGIEKGLQEQKLKKIGSNTKSQYYIFPMIYEQKYGIYKELHKQFNITYCLDLCREEYKNFDLLGGGVKTNKKNIEVGSQRWNWWVDGYTTLKEQWLHQQQIKSNN